MDYVSAEGVNLVGAWYDAQDGRVRSAFDLTLRILRESDDWSRRDVKEFKELTGRHAGLGEICFDIPAPGAKKQVTRRFRVAGFARHIEHEFVIILGCEKTGRIYSPLDAFEQAMVYKRKLDQGIGTTHDHDLC